MTQDASRVLIFDTTLRDGEQSPGASMDIEEKVQIALALNDLNVDVIFGGLGIELLPDISDTIDKTFVTFKELNNLV